MGIIKSKIQPSKETEKNQKSETQKKVHFDLPDNEISVENINKFIDELLNNKNINIKYIPDQAEREIYKNTFLIVMNVLNQTLKSSKIEFMGHQILLSLKPNKKIEKL